MVITTAREVDVEEARRRFESLANGLYGPVIRSVGLDVILSVVGVVLGLGAAITTGEPMAALIVSVLYGLVAVVFSWGWLRDRARRQAWELLSDHDRRERIEWRAESGTDLPRTVPAAKRWLEEHPDLNGREALLTRLGRLDEARAALLAKHPDIPVDALHTAVMLRSVDLYAGGRPNTIDLHATWADLDVTPTKGLRRACLAILDAQLAIERGEDPAPVLAAARDDVGIVPPSKTTGDLMRSILVAHLLLTITVTLLAVWLTA